jgi:hypothetical protein
MFSVQTLGPHITRNYCEFLTPTPHADQTEFLTSFTQRIYISLVSPFDRHRGGGHQPTPATPPCVRVRTRRFEMVTLVHILQIRESERFEIGCGKRDGYGLGVGEVPGTAAATGCVASQFWTDAQCQESCPTTTDGFPLSPECHTKSRTDPASKVREDARSFAEAELTAPAPHVWG